MAIDASCTIKDAAKHPFILRQCDRAAHPVREIRAVDDLEGSQTFLQAAIGLARPPEQRQQNFVWWPPAAPCCFCRRKSSAPPSRRPVQRGTGRTLRRCARPPPRRMISTSLSSRTEIRPLVPQISSKLVPGHSWAEAIKCPWAPLR